MSGTIDHIAIRAPKDQFDHIVDWYKKALAPLNVKEIMREPGGGGVGLGSENPDFWIMESNEPSASLHVAFVAPGHAAVDAFHQAALAAGGKCNGPPGPRADYHPEYYGAFVLDPLGNNVEVVDHPCTTYRLSKKGHAE